MNRLTTTTLLLGLILAGTLQSCKKGENDPFLSLHTRKARICGDWTMTSSAATTVYVQDSSKLTNAGTNDGTATTMVSTMETGGTSTSTTTVTPYTLTMSMKKDGTYTQVHTVDGAVTTIDGTWTFLAKNKDNDLKGKEAIILTQHSVTTSSGTSTTDNVSGQTYILGQLKNKEMEWNIHTLATTYYGSTETTESTTTWKQN